MAKGQDEPKTWEHQKRRVIGLLDTFDEWAVAELTGLSVGEVRRAAQEVPPREKWWGRDKKTGATISGTQRGVYRMVQLRGWVDWEWGRA